MKKYKVSYSLVVKAESREEAVDKFGDAIESVEVEAIKDSAEAVRV